MKLIITTKNRRAKTAAILTPRVNIVLTVDQRAKFATFFCLLDTIDVRMNKRTATRTSKKSITPTPKKARQTAGPFTSSYSHLVLIQNYFIFKYRKQVKTHILFTVDSNNDRYRSFTSQSGHISN